MESHQSQPIESDKKLRAKANELAAVEQVPYAANTASEKLSDERFSSLSADGLKAIRSVSDERSVVARSLPFFAVDNLLNQETKSREKQVSSREIIRDIVSPSGRDLINVADKQLLKPGYPRALAEHSLFLQDVKAFEDNARALNLPQGEIEATYKNVQRLLVSTGTDQKEVTAGGAQSARQRIRVAEQLINMAANPRDRNQGEHDTCAMAVVEGMLLMGKSAEPSKLAKMVADVTLTGQTNVNGVIAKVDSDSLKSHGEMADNRAVGEDKQRLAENIFRLTAANLYFGMERAKGTSEGQLRYVSRNGDDHLQYVPDPPGGLTHDVKLEKVNDPKDVITTASTAASSEGESRILNKITGRDYSKRIITYGPENSKDAGWVTNFSNEEQFDNQLKKLKNADQLPAAIDVLGVHKEFDSVPNPFMLLSDVNHSSESEKAVDKLTDTYEATHALLVTDRVEMEGAPFYSLKNTWGADSNTFMSKDALYQTTRNISPLDIIDDLVAWKNGEDAGQFHDGSSRQGRESRFAVGLLAASSYIVDMSLHPPDPVDPELIQDSAKSARIIKELIRQLPYKQQYDVDRYLRNRKLVTQEENDRWQRLGN